MRALFCIILLVGCGSTSQPSPASTSTPVTEVPPAAAPAAFVALKAGEPAAWTEEAGVIRVNNRLCAVSHSPLDPAKLSAYTSTVDYTGTDPRVQGKRMVFNQCCEMCIEKFPAMWASDPDAVLQFHGLL